MENSLNYLKISEVAEQNNRAFCDKSVMMSLFEQYVSLFEQRQETRETMTRQEFLVLSLPFDSPSIKHYY